MFRNFFIFSLLASSAMGISLTDAVQVHDVSSTLSFEATSTITVVVTLDVETLKSYMLAGQSNEKHSLVSMDSLPKSIALGTSGNGEYFIDRSGLYGFLGDEAQTYGIGLGNDSDIGFETMAFWEGAAIAAATLTYRSTPPETGSEDYGLAATFTLLDNSGNTILQDKKDTSEEQNWLTSFVGGEWNEVFKTLPFTITSVSFDEASVTSAYVFTEVLSIEESNAMAVAAGKAMLIPEPATATLSLLALAGLAARRRRASR